MKFVCKDLRKEDHDPLQKRESQMAKDIPDFTQLPVTIRRRGQTIKVRADFVQVIACPEGRPCKYNLKMMNMIEVA